jgi:positive regulator of sigma E activity
MKTERDIAHHGIVMSTKDNAVYIRVILKQSCDSCESEALCSIPHFDKNIVEVKNAKGKFSKGEKVIIIVSRFSEWSEQILVYFIPAIILIICFLLIKSMTGNFNLAGIIAISFFGLYFSLYHFVVKKKIESYLKYHIKKMD